MKYCKCFLFLLLFRMSACAVEPDVPKSDNEIAAALHRATVLRLQTGVVTAVLQEAALVMKLDGVVCGRASLTLADARGEGGAAYKLVLRSRDADPVRGAVEQKNTLLLDAGFGLLSSRAESSAPPAAPYRISTTRIEKDTLIFESELKTTGEPKVTRQRTKLNGVRPVPEDILFVFAALASGGKPLCVPVVRLHDIAPLIDPVWIGFSQYGGKTEVVAHTLVGEIAENGLVADVPNQDVWKQEQSWVLDDKYRVLTFPKVPNVIVAVETVRPDSVDFDAPFELDKLFKNQKAAKK